jgi:alkanesulfonate monooxygenase SsuD/methylene tetrahydromethanopterin reductase-like flavin-dependent oxidoreductase (luciferase family)
VPLGRNPFLLAKELAQLDQLSDGRLLLSFVTGQGRRDERAALGLGDASRGDVLERSLELIRRWWSGATVDEGPFAPGWIRPGGLRRIRWRCGWAAAGPRRSIASAGSPTAGSGRS